MLTVFFLTGVALAGLVFVAALAGVAALAALVDRAAHRANSEYETSLYHHRTPFTTTAPHELPAPRSWSSMPPLTAPGVRGRVTNSIENKGF